MLMVLALLMACTVQNDAFAKTDNTKAAEKNQHNKTAKGGVPGKKKPSIPSLRKRNPEIKTDIKSRRLSLTLQRKQRNINNQLFQLIIKKW